MAGVVERGGKVKAAVVEPPVSGKNIVKFLKQTVDPRGSLLVTDEHKAYHAVEELMPHVVINHSAGCYADGPFHTNTIEGFWSLLKRAWYGSHHHYRKRYTPLYVSEQVWKYNRRGGQTSSETSSLGVSREPSLLRRLPHRHARPDGVVSC